MAFTGVSKDRAKKPQGTEKKKDEPSISVSIQPSIPPAPERRTSPSPAPTEREKEDGQELLEGENETQPFEKVQKREEKEAGERMRDEEMVEKMYVVVSDEEQKGEAEEQVDGSLFSSSISLPPSGLDGIVDKHLGKFSSDIQLLLQEQSIHYSLPQSQHSTSTQRPQHTLPHTLISQFSQYVSFYNTRPPVQDYVTTLQERIDSMMLELDDRWPSHKPGTGRPEADAALESRVSDFVSSIRAANANTGRDDDDGLCCELTAADVGASVSQNPALSRGSDVWQPHATTTKQVTDATDRNSPTLRVTISVTTSASDSSDTSVRIPPPAESSQSHGEPPQSHTLEINSGGGKPSTEPSQSSVPVSSSASASVAGSATVPAPPAAALSSLISQLQPEVFNSLVKIIKDVKRNSVQFYLHNIEPEDQVLEDVRKYLLKLGNAEQSPVAFLNQENCNSRLLVIIKNKDIAGHIHTIPGLVSLKRHASVVFVGVDTLDDIKNNSYNELFVSGGCIVSDELILNPDFITYDRLVALLVFLEHHNSLESIWRWKVHCKTHKKLKEQARFRRDAASLLDILSAYQKRQIVEFLPYHHCDMMNHQSPDLHCLMELQARYTQYRHTILLTDHHSEKFPAYSSGIIAASIDEILHDFTRVVGYHDIKDRQPILEHIHPLSSHDQSQHLLQQSGSILPTLSRLSDQLVPDAKDGVPPHSETEFEVLRQAISQLRAERQAQLQQQCDSQAELNINSLNSFLPNLVPAGSTHTTTPLLPHGGPTESGKVTHDRKAVAATLDLIHSVLQQEPVEERKNDRAGTPTEGRGRTGRSQGGEARDQRDGTPVRVVRSKRGDWGPSNSDTSTPSSNQSTAAVTGGAQTDSSSDRRKKSDQRGEPVFPSRATRVAPSSSTTARPVEGNRSRDTQSGQERPIRGEGAPPGSSTASRTKIRQPQQRLQQRNNKQLQPSPSHLQQPPQSLQSQWGTGLMHPPHLPQFPNRPLSRDSMPGPPTALGDGILGPTPVWPGGLVPAGTSALGWGFQQAGRDFKGTRPRVRRGYHNPAGQGSNRYRGGQR